MSKRVAAIIVVSTLRILAASMSAQAGEDKSPQAELMRLAHDWEHVKLRVTDRNDRESQMASLVQRAENISKQYENSPDPVVWLGMLMSEQAALANENGSPLKAWELAN